MTMDRIYILYHGSFGELVTGHLAMSELADRIVSLYDLKITSVSLDEPENDMPEDIPLPECDLLLVLGILPKAGDLVPIIAERTGAKAVLWPVEDPNLIPEGKYSIEEELKKRDIHVEFPEPLCSLATSENKLVGMSYEDMKSFEEQVMQMHDNECVAYMGPERPIMQQAGRLLADAIKEALYEHAQ